MRRLRVVIADDHAIFREGLRRVIERDSQMEVVGEADNGEAAITCIAALRPDVAVVDVDMPVKDGFAVLRAIRSANPNTRAIFLTMHNNGELFHSAFAQGVSGYVLKDGAVSEIVAGIRTVASGRNFISPELSTFALQHLGHASASVPPDTDPLQSLTPTEQRILHRIAESRSSREIAEELFISVRTVEHHRANICGKLRLSGSNALIKFALTHRSQLP